MAAQSLTTPTIALLSIRLIALTAYRLNVSAKCRYLEYLPSYSYLLTVICSTPSIPYKPKSLQRDLELGGVLSSPL